MLSPPRPFESSESFWTLIGCGYGRRSGVLAWLAALGGELLAFDSLWLVAPPHRTIVL
jgi:hypothetical protein